MGHYGVADVAPFCGRVGAGKFCADSIRFILTRQAAAILTLTLAARTLEFPYARGSYPAATGTWTVSAKLIVLVD